MVVAVGESAPENLDNTNNITGNGKATAIVVMDNNAKKKKGGFNFFKAAAIMLRKNSRTNVKKLLPPVEPEADAKATANNWQKIVGSMRPLTLQEENASPRHPDLLEENVEQQQQSPPVFLPRHRQIHSSPSLDCFEDAMIAVSPSCSSSSGTMSQYASANNLHAMDETDDEEEDEDVVFDNKPADAMIDAKAEEFIARFYAQMRRQG